MRRLVLGAVLGALASLTAPAAAGAEDLFAEANAEYAAQRYAAAVEKYEELRRSGLEHPTLYYNLGNAYFRLDRLGPAILSYERALRLDPRAEDIRYNLEVAREHAAEKLGRDTVAGAQEDPFWIRAVEWLPLNTTAWIFLAFDVVFFGLLILIRFLPSGFLRTGLVVGDVFVGLAGAVFGILLLGHIHLQDNVRLSIVVADEVTMREGPDHTRREMPTLHAGHRVVILRESQGWVRIRLANRVEGWVPKGTVEEI